LLEYKAQSPDEAALVQAAADVGFEFRGRDRDVLTMRTPFALQPLRFRLLNILEFTSARKRMSVLVRQLGEGDEPGNNPILLLCKGADNVVYDRLAPGGDELKAVTEEQLSMFANEGLRTLTLAYRVVPDGEYDAWVERYRGALASVEDREGEIERVSDEVERNLLLLGATAIEDKLQDGVPEAIADLKKAGIKVWVLTGDKLETAIGSFFFLYISVVCSVDWCSSLMPLVIQLLDIVRTLLGLTRISSSFGEVAEALASTLKCWAPSRNISQTVMLRMMAKSTEIQRPFAMRRPVRRVTRRRIRWAV
jgi:hypothetical protein